MTSNCSRKVPLIIKPVGSTDAARRVEEPIHVMDLMPAILELAEVEPPRQWKGAEVARIQGQSLLPLIEGSTDPSWMERGLGWEAYGMDAYRRGHWKILRLPTPYGN